MGKTIEELEAELARQHEELTRVTAAFEEMPASARFEVPSAFFEDLEAACLVPSSAPTQLISGLRA